MEGAFFETEDEEEDEDEDEEVEDGVGAENKVSLISDIFLQTFKWEAAHARSEGVIGVAWFTVHLSSYVLFKVLSQNNDTSDSGINILWK